MDSEPNNDNAVGPRLSEELATVFYQIVRSAFVMPESELVQDLPILQIRLLRIIDEQPGQKVVDLASAVGLSVSRISRMLTGFASRGLVERVPDRHDKRVLRIYLHEVARHALQQRETQQAARMESCLKFMSPEAAVTLVESLHLLKRAVEKSSPRQ